MLLLRRLNQIPMIALPLNHIRSTQQCHQVLHSTTRAALLSVAVQGICLLNHLPALLHETIAGVVYHGVVVQLLAQLLEDTLEERVAHLVYLVFRPSYVYSHDSYGFFEAYTSFP